MAEVILIIGVLVFIAHFFTALFAKTKIPDVLSLTLLGILIGPVFHLVQPSDFGQVGRVISSIALLVILFESGITLDPDVFLQSIRPTLRLTLATFAVTIALVTAFGVYVMALQPLAAFMLGAILGGTSAAVVIALVKSMNVKEPSGTILVMESAIGDVLCVLLLLGLIEAHRAGHVEPIKIFGGILSSLTFAAIVGLVGGILWLLVLDTVRQFPHTIFTTLAAAFIVYGTADLLGFSGAIAVLAFGATLTNHERIPIDKIAVFRGRTFATIEDKDKSFFMEVLFLLKTFFFLFLGVSIKLDDFRSMALAAGLIGAIYLARFFLVKLTVGREKEIAVAELSLMSVMVPKGLVSAVLADLPIAAQVPGAEAMKDFTYYAVIVSVLLTAVLLPLLSRAPLSGLYHGFYSRKALETE